jgi:hypothetical protein
MVGKTHLSDGARLIERWGWGDRLEKAWTEKENVFPAKTCKLDGPTGAISACGDGAAGGLAVPEAEWAARLAGLKAWKNDFWIKNWFFEFIKALEICTGRFRRNFDMRIFPKFF